MVVLKRKTTNDGSGSGDNAKIRLDKLGYVNEETVEGTSARD